MRREEMATNTLEERIKSYYQVETSRLHAPADLWQRLEGLLGEQDRPSAFERATRAIARRLALALPTRQSGPRMYVLTAACATAALIVAVGLAAIWSGRAAPASLARDGVPVLPTQAVGSQPEAPVAQRQPTTAQAEAHITAPTVAPPLEQPAREAAVTGSSASPAGTPTAQPEATARPTASGSQSAGPVPDQPSQGAPPAPFGTPQPEKPSTQVSASPRLNQGTLEEAQRAIGVTIVLPRYLPADAVREGLVHYYVREGRGMVSVAYRVGQRHLAVEYLKQPADEVVVRKGQPATVGRFPAEVYTQPREPSDSLPPMSEVAWRDGEVTVRVRGDLPPAELLKVAQSLY